MAQVLLLKINATNGKPQEHSSTADDVTFATITANGGPVISGTGIDMQNDDISDLGDLTLTDNLSSVTFQLATDTANQLDQLIVPYINGTPTATAVNAALVFDYANGLLYMGLSSGAWTNAFATASSAPQVSTQFTAAVSILVNDIVYLSAANTVNRADANLGASALPFGVALANAPGGSLVSVAIAGVANGFSGLTAGARYYLSEVAGGVTVGFPTTSAADVVQVGIAKSASQMIIQIDDFGVRA